MTTQTVETKKTNAPADAVVAGVKKELAGKTATASTVANAQAAQNKQGELTAIMVPMGRIKLGSNSSRMLTKLADDPDTKRLAAEIKEVGLLHNLVVGPMDKDGKYELRAGFRRLEALKLLGWKEVPVHINTASSARVVNLYENFKRKDITPMEFALSLQAIAMEKKWRLPYVDGKPKAKNVYHVGDMAKLLKCSTALISEHCKLLALPPKVQKKVHEGELAARGGFALATLNVDEDTFAEVMAVAEQLQEKKEEKKAKKVEEKRGKVTPTEASKVTMAAAKAEKKKKKVEAGTVKAAAAKVAQSKKVEADKAKAQGNTAKAEKLEKEAKSLEKAASKSGGAGKTLGDWTEIVKQVKGEGEGCDDFAKVYENWLKGEAEDEDVVSYLVTALNVGETDEIEVA